VLPAIHTLLGFTASDPVVLTNGAPGIAFLPMGLLGGASDPGVIAVPPPPPGGGMRRKRKRIDELPPDLRHLLPPELRDELEPEPVLEPAASVKFTKAERKLAQAVARARSADPATAERARAFLDSIRANADSDLARLLARQQALDEQRRGERMRVAAEDEDAVMAMMQWLMSQ
jgi:hypothetical protein